MDKTVQMVLVEARRQGFAVRTTTGGHTQVRTPDGLLVAAFAGDRSDCWAIGNKVAHMRRFGFAWPPRAGR